MCSCLTDAYCRESKVKSTEFVLTGPVRPGICSTLTATWQPTSSLTGPYQFHTPDHIRGVILPGRVLVSAARFGGKSAMAASTQSHLVRINKGHLSEFHGKKSHWSMVVAGHRAQFESEVATLPVSRHGARPAELLSRCRRSIVGGGRRHLGALKFVPLVA